MELTSVLRENPGEPVSMRKAYGEALVEVGKRYPNVVVLSADVSNSDFSYMFESAYPERFYNVGIAEPALVDVSVGLANAGRIPIANTFAFLFATRAVEMVRTHLCYGRSNVKLAGAYAGMSDSFDGPTHHAITDMAVLRAFPNMTVVCPADPMGVARLLPKVVEWNGPVYMRLCRNEVPQIYSDAYAPEIGKGIVLAQGSDVTLFTCGVMVARVLEAARRLEAQGVSARVVEMHTIKPLDVDLVARCAEETGAVVTVEEHSIVGGLGGAVSEALGSCYPVPVERVGVPDTFAETGPYNDILDKYGLSIDHITSAAQRAVDRKKFGRR